MLQKRSRKLAVIVAAVGLLASTLTASAAPAQHSTSGVYWLADFTPVEGASASLLRTDTGVRMTLHTSQLEPGAAHTVWWVIFNNPDACTHGMGSLQCGEGDLLVFGGDPAVMSSVLHAAGHVVGHNGIGNFASHLRVGQLTHDVLWGEGLLNPLGAEIHLVVLTHGAPIPGMVDDQIHTFAGGCHINDCAELQFAVFPAP